jgi:hypothetical protein
MNDFGMGQGVGAPPGAGAGTPPPGAMLGAPGDETQFAMMLGMAFLRVLREMSGGGAPMGQPGGGMSPGFGPPPTTGGMTTPPPRGYPGGY